MLFGKKKRIYSAYSQITDYVRSSSADLYNRLYDPGDGPGLLCSTAVVLVFLQILMEGSSEHTNLYLINFQDQPEIQHQVLDSVNRLIDVYETPAAREYFKSMEMPDKISRLVADPANILIDHKYCALIYAAQALADLYGAEYSYRVSLSDIPVIYHRFFISQERTAFPLVQSLRQLLQ